MWRWLQAYVDISPNPKAGTATGSPKGGEVSTGSSTNKADQPPPPLSQAASYCLRSPLHSLFSFSRPALASPWTRQEMATIPLLHPVQATPGGWLASLNPNSEFPEEGKRPAQLGLTVSEVWAVRSDFLLKRIAWIGVGRVNKSDKCYLCQVTKVNIKW